MNPRSTGYADPVMLLCAGCERTIITERQHTTPLPPRGCPFCGRDMELEILAPLQGSPDASPDCIMCAEPAPPPVLTTWEGGFVTGFVNALEIVRTHEGDHLCDRHLTVLDAVCRKRVGIGFMRFPGGAVRSKGGAA